MFEWDDNKNKSNQEKHGISFENASFVFDDPNVLTYEERNVGDEVRYQAIGEIAGVVVVLVAFTYREKDGQEVIRIISARKASRKERELYAENAR